MWLRTVIVVSVVTCVVCVTDNDIPEDSLQELITRSKKSPAIITSREKKIWMKPGEENRDKIWSELKEDPESTKPRSLVGDEAVEPDMKAMLVEDIRREVEELKELDSAYRQAKSEYLNKKNSDISPDNSKLLKILEEKIPLETKISTEELNNDETIRPARQPPFMPLPGYHDEYYETHHTFRPGGPPSRRPFMGPGYPGPPPLVQNYQEVSKTYIDGYGRPPTILRAVQYNPSARTYGAAGIQGEISGGYKSETNHIPPGKTLKQLKQLIPNVINVLSEIVPPPKPEPNVYAGGHGGGHHEKKPIQHAAVHPLPTIGHGTIGKGGLPPVFYSKQIVFGVGTDKKIGEKHYGGQGHYPQGYSFYPQGHSYLQPSYPFYPEAGVFFTPYSDGFGYGSSASAVAQAHSSPTPANGQPLDKAFYNPLPEDGGSDTNFRNVQDLSLDELEQNSDSASTKLLGVTNSAEDSGLEVLMSDIAKEKEKIQKLKEKIKPEREVGLKDVDNLNTKWEDLKQEVLQADSSKQDEPKKKEQIKESEVKN